MCRWAEASGRAGEQARCNPRIAVVPLPSPPPTSTLALPPPPSLQVLHAHHGLALPPPPSLQVVHAHHGYDSDVQGHLEVRGAAAVALQLAHAAGVELKGCRGDGEGELYRGCGPYIPVPSPYFLP